MLSRRLHTVSTRGALGLVLGALMAAITGCASGTTIISTATSTSTGALAATATSTVVAAATATASTSIPVKVYFSKHPDSDNNVNVVVAADRTSPTLGVGTFAIQQLIAGPSATEAAAGLYTELTASLTGASNCGGPDFQYTIDNGTHTGTLKFCKVTSLAGDLTGARIQAEITKTLTQFPNVTKVIILNSTGHCFNDLSGMDSCLH
ncbi:MAG TPA: GerMN domain-containing protein [Ktedonobacterales bacterium]|jgi:spore germination protein GerM|nr:GerMN domain-containing protein [Ktedonobacterales bacterium]